MLILEISYEIKDVFNNLKQEEDDKKPHRVICIYTHVFKFNLQK